MKRHGQANVIITDKLRSYGAAMKVLGNAEKQETGRWLNNRGEKSHQPFRRRERDAAVSPDAKFAEVRLRSLVDPQPFQL